MEDNLLELKEMREQISLLKEKLANENIVNDRLLRESTKSKIFGIQRQATIIIIAGLFAAPYSIWAFRNIGLSWFFCGATAVMLLFCSCMTALMHSRINSNRAASGSLVECVKQMKKLKQQYIDWYKIAIPMLAVWIIWLAIETIRISSGTPVLWLVIGMLIGAGVGGFIGFRAHKKVIDTCDDVIASIEDLQ